MKKIAIILFDGVEVLDFAGPFEVFSVTGRRETGQPFEVFTVAENEIVFGRNQLKIIPTYTLDNCPAVDIFLVPGGGGYDADGKPFGSRKEMDNPVLLNWIQQRTSSVDFILSVCTGALILAKARLLKDLSATTHFMAVETLRKIAPDTKVLPEKRFVDNGKIILSAGVSAGIDMALYMVEKLSGKNAAVETAKYMQYDYYDMIDDK